jgi:hypothetical protein
MWFLLGEEGDFIMFSMLGQQNGSFKKRIIKTIHALGYTTNN